MKKPAVLIVDDDPSHLRIYGWIIQSAGFEPVSATGRNLLQPRHQEFTGNNSNAAGIRRSVFGTVNWTWQMFIADFLSRGGMIQFQVVEKRVRFSVNLDAVNHRNLTMSSELLKVAMSAKGRAPKGGAL